MSNPEFVRANLRSFFSDYPPEPNFKGWLVTLDEKALTYLLRLFVTVIIQGEDTDEGLFATQVLASIAINLNRAGIDEEGMAVELNDELMNMAALLISFVEMEALRRAGNVNYQFSGPLRRGLAREMKFSSPIANEQDMTDALLDMYSERLEMPREVVESYPIVPEAADLSAPKTSRVPEELISNINPN